MSSAAAVAEMCYLRDETICSVVISRHPGLTLHPARPHVTCSLACTTPVCGWGIMFVWHLLKIFLALFQLFRSPVYV